MASSQLAASHQEDSPNHHQSVFFPLSLNDAEALRKYANNVLALLSHDNKAEFLSQRDPSQEVVIRRTLDTKNPVLHKLLAHFIMARDSSEMVLLRAARDVDEICSVAVVFGGPDSNKDYENARRLVGYLERDGRLCYSERTEVDQIHGSDDGSNSLAMINHALRTNDAGDVDRALQMQETHVKDEAFVDKEQKLIVSSIYHDSPESYNTQVLKLAHDLSQVGPLPFKNQHNDGFHHPLQLGGASEQVHGYLDRDGIPKPPYSDSVEESISRLVEGRFENPQWHGYAAAGSDSGYMNSDNAAEAHMNAQLIPGSRVMNHDGAYHYGGEGDLRERSGSATTGRGQTRKEKKEAQLKHRPIRHKGERLVLDASHDREPVRRGVPEPEKLRVTFQSVIDDPNNPGKTLPGNPAVYVFKQGVDWYDPISIVKINSWRSQLYRRIVGPKEETRYRWTQKEEHFLVSLVQEHLESPEVDGRYGLIDWEFIASQFNAKWKHHVFAKGEPLASVRITISGTEEVETKSMTMLRPTICRERTPSALQNQLSHFTSPVARQLVKNAKAVDEALRLRGESSGQQSALFGDNGNRIKRKRVGSQYDQPGESFFENARRREAGDGTIDPRLFFLSPGHSVESDLSFD